ncbi:hypothetical protein ABK040_004274 [Willaertia magna]
MNLFIFKVLNGLKYSSCSSYDYIYYYNRCIENAEDDDEFLHYDYLIKSTKELEEYILTFCKEFNIDKNNPVFLCRINHAFRDTFEGKGMNYDFAKLIFNDKLIRSESLNKPWRANEGTLLISLLFEGNCNYKIIELLLDRGALINSETINQYSDENTLLDTFFIKYIIRDDESDFIDITYDNNDFNNSSSDILNNEVTLADENIRMLRKLIKAGGKISSTNNFFYNLVELSDCSKLFKVKDLQKLILFFEKELNVRIDIIYLKNTLMRLYSLEKQESFMAPNKKDQKKFTYSPLFCGVQGNIRQFNVDKQCVDNVNKNYKEERKVFNVAIIGSGISGASSAYFLQDLLQKNLQNKNTPMINFHIFERNDRLGGRLREICLQPKEINYCDNNVDNNLFTTNENCNKQFYFEIGGSALISENQYAMNFLNKFNLNIKRSNGYNENISILNTDINRVVFTKTDSYLNQLQSALRYEFGLPLILLKKNILPYLSEEYFMKIYNLQNIENIETLRDVFTFEHVSEFLQKLNMKELTEKSFEQFLKENRIQKKFIKEFCNPILRINYMQSSENISAFGGIIGMAGVVSGFFGVEKGTSALPKYCIKSLQNCKVNLNTNVVNIIYSEKDKKYKLETQNILQNNLLEKKLEKEDFDFVILASPIEFTKNPSLNFTNIELPKEVLQKREFNSLITNIIIAKDLNFKFFKTLNENENYYITTTQPLTKEADQNYPINNIATHYQRFKIKNLQNLIKNLSQHQNTSQNSLQQKFDLFLNDNLDHFLSLQNNLQKNNENYKIFSGFSHKELTKEQLNIYFKEPLLIIKNIWKDGSYPLLKPNLIQHPIKLHENIYYPNAMESIISTMETSCISGKNVSLLIAKKIFGIVNN